MSATEEQRAHRRHLRDLMWALLGEVVRPFRWQVGAILLKQVTAQILLLASLLLPWQLLQVLMSGQSRLTRGLPAQFGDNDKMAMLLALAVLCFCAFALMQWWVKRSISRLFDALLLRLNKTRLVANHRSLGRRMLAIVMGALSSMCIALLFCLVIALLHPALGFLAAVCVAILGLIVARYYRFEKVPQLQETLQSNVLSVINISFALGFVILAIDYLYGSARPLFTLFVLLIALRQMMAASVNGMVNALGIIKHVQHINMLLLPRARQVAIGEATDFLKRFDAARLTQWLPAWLAERHHLAFVDIVECRLLHSRTVAHVLLRTQQDSASPSYWLLKCYVPSRENEAHHEIALLEERSAAAGAMPSEVPKLIGHGDLLWCHYVALDIGSLRPQWLNSEERKPWLAALRQALLQTPLSPSLIAQYRATFATLPERMRSIDTNRFDYLMQDDRQGFQITRFQESWPHMIALIEKVPAGLTLQNPATARLALINQQPLLLDWQGWSHDTLGAHWPLSAKLNGEVLALLSANWPQLTQSPEWEALHSPEEATLHIALAARAHEFCHRCRFDNDAGALNMMAGLLKAHEALRADP